MVQAGPPQEYQSPVHFCRACFPSLSIILDIPHASELILSASDIDHWLIIHEQVELGQTKNNKILGEIYFFRLSLADIIPTSIENAQLINSIARGIGLHDFYQPGLWNFCEGYNDE